MVVGEAQMDKERSRGEPKRSSTSRVSFARRQHKLLSSVHLSGCNGKRHGVAGPVTGTEDDARDGSTVADGWRKGKATTDSGGSYSSNDDGGTGMGGGGGRCRSGEGDKEPGTPPIASTSSTRKRTKLNGKVSDGYVGVDPAVVPRKLRSAMTKRISGSFSSSLPRNGRKRNHLTSDGGSLPFGKAVEVEVGGSLTKDEEDAAETLSAMAIMMVPEAEPVQVPAPSLPKAEDEEKSDSKGSNSADNVEEDLFCSEKFSEGAPPICEPDIPKAASPVVHQERHKFDLELNQPAEVDAKELDLMTIDPSTVDLNDSASFPVVDHVESMPKLFLEKGVVGSPEKASSPSKPDVIVGLMEYPSAITLSLDAKREEKPIHEEKPRHAINVTCREEANVDVRMALPVADCRQLDTTCCSAEPGPSTANTPTDKIQVLSSGRRQTWKKCATHVYIGYLIQHCQMTERKSHIPVPYKRPKLEAITVINEVSRSQNCAKILPSKETDDTTVDRKLFEMTTGSVHDKWQKPVQQPQSMPGLCTQAKQNCDAVTFSAGFNFPNSGGKFDSVAKASTNPAPTAPHHSVVSFSLAPPYPSPYPDQLTAATAQQVQLQLTPQYLANPFYGFHMNPTGGPAKQQLQQTQQQQQMWQAHVTQYWMPPVLPKWQNGRPLDPSQSLIVHPQMPPVLSSSVEAKGIGASHQRPVSIQHQTLPVPLQVVNRSK